MNHKFVLPADGVTSGAVLASRAGYWLLQHGTGSSLVMSGDVIAHGPEVSDAELASIALRRMLADESGAADERAVRDFAEELGLQYVADRRRKLSSRSDVFARVG